MKKNKNKKSKNLLNKTLDVAQNLYINLIPTHRLFLAIFMISAASLSFEIIITRISSVIFTFNYAFILVSLAILGLGCGGIFAFYKLRAQETRILNNIYNILSLYGSLFALSVPFFLFLKWDNIKRSLKISVTVVVVALFSIVLIAANISFGFLGEIPTRNDPLKDLSTALNNYHSKIIDRRWSTF